MHAQMQACYNIIVLLSLDVPFNNVSVMFGRNQ